MEPRIEVLAETKLIGKKLSMSFVRNRTKELWQSSMPKLAAIKNKYGSDFYSIEVYNDVLFFDPFDPNKEFEKWAAIKVEDIDSVPADLEGFTIPSGLYAVFLYKGKASEAPKTYQYIYSEWMPDSGYSLDNRPHFAVMGDKYKNEDPTSEEEIWIPIKKK